MAGLAYTAPSAPPLGEPQVIQATLIPGAPGTSGQHRDTDPVEQVRAGLTELGVPLGLASLLAQEDQRIGLRIYLLDNSGSTAAMDGSVAQQGPGGRYTFRSSSRWDEVVALALDHARWNLTIGVPAEFMLLNSPCRENGMPLVEGRDFVHIERGNGMSDSQQVERLSSMLNSNGPRGVTPITARVHEIHQRIRQDFSAMTSSGQFVFLCICTDGMPTTPFSGMSTPTDQQEMCAALRRICTELPVQLVIRLCTDDEATVEFYNKVDEDMELPMDILDDMKGEANEIRKAGNGWFAYTPLLHRIREAGTMCKLVDLLDERKLTEPEIVKLVQLLSNREQPFSSDPARFVEELRTYTSSSAQVFNVATLRMEPFVDFRAIRAALGLSKCSIM